MKKIYFRIFFALLAVTALGILCGCSFVQYVAVEQSPVLSEEVRGEYIDNISSIFDESLYREGEKETYRVELQDAINELNECNTEKDLQTVYEKHCEIILSIPTDLQLTKDEAKTEIVENQDMNNYHAEARQLLSEYIAYYTDKVDECGTTEEVSKIVQSFKTEVYAVEVDEIVYREELQVLKDEAVDRATGYYKSSEYRKQQQQEIANFIQEFKQTLSACSDKEDVPVITEKYIAMLDGVKTSAEFEREEKTALIDEWYEEIEEIIRSAFGSPTEIEEKMLQAEKWMEEMQSCETIEEVSEKCFATKKEVSAESARLGSSVGLSYLREVVLAEVKSNYDLSLYREAEQTALQQWWSDCKEELDLITDVDMILSYPASAKNDFADILTNDQLWAQEDAQFQEKLKELYGDYILQATFDLTQANDYYELANIIDYYAFYQLDATSFVRDKFRVKLNYEHKTAKWEINEVYWYCELLRSAVGITGWLEEEDYLVIQLVPYALSSVSNRASTERIDKYENLVTYNSDKSLMSSRSADFDDFAYKQYGKTIYGIWNTQQLWYALEHEYVPICVPGSVAETSLNKGKEILREIILEGMTDEEKIFTIYTWIANNVQYDYRYAYYLGSSDMDNFPDEQAATLQSFFMEGALFDGLAVCEGYTKSYLLLLRLEGIESYRVFVRNKAMSGHNAINTQQYTGGGYGSHSYCAIKMADGYFYYSDPEASFISGQQDLETYHQLMITPDLLTGYIGGFTYMYPDMQFGTDICYIYNSLVFDGNDLVVQNKEQLRAILSSLQQYSSTHVQISIVFDQTVYADCKQDLLNIIQSAKMNFNYKEMGRSGRNIKEIVIYIESN